MAWSGVAGWTRGWSWQWPSCVGVTCRPHPTPWCSSAPLTPGTQQEVRRLYLQIKFLQWFSLFRHQNKISEVRQKYCYSELQLDLCDMHTTRSDPTTLCLTLDILDTENHSRNLIGNFSVHPSKTRWANLEDKVVIEVPPLLAILSARLHCRRLVGVGETLQSTIDIIGFICGNLIPYLYNCTRNASVSEAEWQDDNTIIKQKP